MLVALLSLLAITVIVIRSINRPLNKVLHHIDAVRHGHPVADIGSHGNDEWGTIHSALLDMSAELAESQSLLQIVVNTAPMRVFWKDQDLRLPRVQSRFRQGWERPIRKSLSARMTFRWPGRSRQPLSCR